MIVVPSLYSDMICDIAEEITGSLSHGVSIKIGTKGAVFKAFHKKAMAICAAHMLATLGQTKAAKEIHNAYLTAIEENTDIIENLGKEPTKLKKPTYRHLEPKAMKENELSPPSRGRLIGVDIYIYHEGELGVFIDRIVHINVGPYRLATILNRNVALSPEEKKRSSCCEQWCCRFLTDRGVQG